MWCKTCNRETNNEKCEYHDNITKHDIPLEVFLCKECNAPIIKYANDIDKDSCLSCHAVISYLCADLRPVFLNKGCFLN